MPSLTTFQMVKEYLVGIGEAIPDDHESTVDFFIRSASDKFENACGRRFSKQTYTAELYFGVDGRESTDIAPFSGFPVHGKTLSLRQWPVVTVTAVTITEGGVATAITEGTGNANWKRARDGRGDWVGLYREDGWKSDPLGIAVTYDAGYVLPGPDVSNRDLPYDLEEAIVAIAGGSYQHRGRTMVPSESFEGLSQQIDRWPLWVLKVVGVYKRRGT